MIYFGKTEYHLYAYRWLIAIGKLLEGFATGVYSVITPIYCKFYIYYLLFSKGNISKTYNWANGLLFPIIYN